MAKLMDEEQSQIPTGKIQRATRFVKTGIKVGGNYLKHYSKKLVNPDLDETELNQQNAEDIYGALSELKGSALKVAQMLSMDKGILPAAFSQEFSKSQNKAPALSGPLIVKTFKQYLGKSPSDLFDEFGMEATHAASIGQVHRAKLNGKELAIKIQYPGVKDSIISDLNMVRPIARRMFGWRDVDLEVYFQEVKERLVEETDYELELKRGQFISEKTKDLPNLEFPTYYPELSSDRIITMDWLEGLHLDAFLATNPSQEIRNQAGQSLWDFYNFQVHELKTMHADAHPGNFLFRENGTIGILDFGCVKEIPLPFYKNYFKMLDQAVLEDEEAFLACCKKMNMIFDTDTPEEVAMYSSLLKETLSIVIKPFQSETFDFGDQAYFDSMYAYGEEMSQRPEIRHSKVPRGDKDGIYMNRAYFGLFSIMHELNAVVKTRNYFPE